MPPPRPKRKAAHPYPQKASKNGWPPSYLLDCISILNLICYFADTAVLVPLQALVAHHPSISAFTIMPEHAQLDDSSILISPSSGNTKASQDELTNLQAADGMKPFCMCFLMMSI